MSAIKKLIRDIFRKEVFERDKALKMGEWKKACKVCTFSPSFSNNDTPLDAHHITDRSLMPNGGYVKENGIALCGTCHQRAETFHQTGVATPGYEPETLYRLIGSSYELAVEKSHSLKVR